MAEFFGWVVVERMLLPLVIPVPALEVLAYDVAVCWPASVAEVPLSYELDLVVVVSFGFSDVVTTLALDVFPGIMMVAALELV